MKRLLLCVVINGLGFLVFKGAAVVHPHDSLIHLGIVVSAIGFIAGLIGLLFAVFGTVTR